MSCIVPEPATFNRLWAPRTLRSKLDFSAAVSTPRLRTLCVLPHCSPDVASIVAPPRRNVIARPDTSSFTLTTSRRLLALQSRFEPTGSTPRIRTACVSVLPKQQRRTQQLAATSLGSSHLSAPLLAVSTHHDLSLRRNSHLHEQSQLSISFGWVIGRGTLRTVCRW